MVIEYICTAHVSVTFEHVLIVIWEYPDFLVVNHSGMTMALFLYCNRVIEGLVQVSLLAIRIQLSPVELMVSEISQRDS